ncbi:MAG: NAD(P)H-hydrate epimerase [Candidatus Dormibacter sp.]
MIAVTSVSVAQMREVDRLMTEEVGIGLVQMMENAGRCLATHARGMLGGDVRVRRVCVLAGRGGNGGGGLVAARRLSVWGAAVTVVLAQSRDDMRGVPLQQLTALEWTGIRIRSIGDGALDLAQADLVIDALIGYSLRGAPAGPVLSLIRTANASGRRVLALDLPSGLDGDSGEPSDPTIRATETLTLALPKRGLLAPSARPWVGQLHLADISVPEAVYGRLGLTVGPIFATSDIIPIDLS